MSHQGQSKISTSLQILCSPCSLQAGGLHSTEMLLVIIIIIIIKLKLTIKGVIKHMTTGLISQIHVKDLIVFSMIGQVLDNISHAESFG